MNPVFRRVLVCRTDALGDAILALPVCTALKKTFPGARVSLWVAEPLRDFFAGQPGPDEVWGYASGGGRDFWRLCRRVRAGGFDAALLVFPEFRLSLAVWLAGVPVRVGTARRLWSVLFSRRVSHSRAQAVRHEADYNLDLVRALGAQVQLEPPRLRVDRSDALWAGRFLRSLGWDPRQRLVILHPGGRGSAANWPPRQYGLLARRLQREHGVHVLLTGSPAEEELLAVAARYCDPAPWRLHEAVSLGRLAALIAQARIFISGSTGPMHLAAALGIPTVSLFPAAGVTGPARWRPLARRQEILVPTGSGQAVPDLSGIPIEPVYEAARRLLSGAGTNPAQRPPRRGGRRKAGGRSHRTRSKTPGSAKRRAT